jgi:hypothetical protein
MTMPLATTTRRAGPVRGYSKDFTPNAETAKRYLLDLIPAALWLQVRAKAKREGVSMRALILQLLTDWVNA